MPIDTPIVAIDAARQMVVFMKRAGGQSQFSVPLAAQTRDHGFVELSRLNGDQSRGEDLSRAASGSPRLCHHRGPRANQTVEMMWLQAACRALGDTDLPLKTIAMVAGHGNEQKLHGASQRQRTTTPALHRVRFSA